jgi:hypothetical protein
MPLVLANRVQETATPNTTVSFTLTGAVSGFQTFAVIGNTNTTYYSATDSSGNWEVGLGTYATSGPTLTRTTIYASSNSGSAVTFPGSVNVFVTYPSGRSVNLDGSGNVSALGTVSSGTWQGSTVGVAYGGTGVTVSSGPNSVVLRDANENITVNRISQGLQTITASGGTTTLTAASDFNQQLIGTGGHTFRLPDATTLTDTTTFQFNNNATGTLTIQNNAATTVGTVAPGGAAGIALMNNATSGGTWDVHGYLPEAVTWGTNALALGSTVISGGTWQGGTIQSGYGGTGLTTFAGANNALYSTSASALAAGTLPVVAGGTGVTTSTGSGSVVLSTSPALVTPALGTPTSGNFSTGTFTWPTFNQNTTGTASNVTGTVAIANGGTGQTTQQAALNALSGTQTANRVLRSNGTNVTLSQVALATDVSGTLPVANGGTGQTSYTDGQLLIGNTTGNTLAKATLTAGTNITITNGPGAITIAASGGGASAATPTTLGTVYGKTQLAACGGRVALGQYAGETSQSQSSVAIGTNAGKSSQGQNAVALGICAGGTSQGSRSVSIGLGAGNAAQAGFAIAIGAYAGFSSQGSGAIAIGDGAGTCSQHSCSIAIGKNTTTTGTCRTHIGPLRNACIWRSVYYNPCTRELTYFCCSA